ncbi:hypothetical protein BVRB_8g183830 [Beta vulgaris subsp. vulgaris]|nr:hypothetical protein BVRB_8g183830 [Beta vulgaris subsp. vulgaris]
MRLVANSLMISSSVLEGVGKTLKGGALRKELLQCFVKRDGEMKGSG